MLDNHNELSLNVGYHLKLHVAIIFSNIKNIIFKNINWWL